MRNLLFLTIADTILVLVGTPSLRAAMDAVPLAPPETVPLVDPADLPPIFRVPPRDLDRVDNALAVCNWLTDDARHAILRTLTTLQAAPGAVLLSVSTTELPEILSALCLDLITDRSTLFHAARSAAGDGALFVFDLSDSPPAVSATIPADIWDTFAEEPVEDPRPVRRQPTATELALAFDQSAF